MRGFFLYSTFYYPSYIINKNCPMETGTLVLPFNEDITEKRKEIEERIIQARNNLQKVTEELSNLQNNCLHEGHARRPWHDNVFECSCAHCGKSWYSEKSS